MKGAKRFLLDVSIISPDLTERSEMKLKVSLTNANSGYGNDTYMTVKSRNGDSFEQCFDIRYDKTFDKNKPEVFILNWVYNYWSGENGSWSILGCSIKVNGVRRKPLNHI